MRIVTPSFHIVAETAISYPSTYAMLDSIGASEWVFPDDAESDSDKVVEIMGRLCYKSFGTELNPNITKVRDGNMQYLANILNTKHGSVLEHSSVSVVFLNVSRILTHELVRHGDGTAFSQESMRFVRMDDIPMYIPDLHEEWMALASLMVQKGLDDAFTGEPVTGDSEDAWVDHIQQEFESYLKEQALNAEKFTYKIGKMLDEAHAPFTVKKAITSVIRRGAPSGHATNIGMTANHRAWRWIFETRTKLDPNHNLTAEREIHELMLKVAEAFKTRYPAIYQDMTLIQHGDNGTCEFINSKV
jgi:thymidylate synthase (FAD)